MEEIIDKNKSRVGYALIRHPKDNITKQIQALEYVGCDPIYKDVSPFFSDARPGMYLLLSELEDQSEVVITTPNIFGSVDTFKNFMEVLHEKKCTLLFKEKWSDIHVHFCSDLTPDELKNFINVFNRINRF